MFTLWVIGELSLKDVSRSFCGSESWARVTYYRAASKGGKGNVGEKSKTKYKSLAEFLKKEEQGKKNILKNTHFCEIITEEVVDILWVF